MYNPGLAFLLFVIAAIIGLIWQFAIAQIAARNDLAGADRRFWLLLAVMVPVFGMVFYFSFGPKMKK